MVITNAGGQKVGKVSAGELCQKLKDESEASQDDDAVNKLRIRILWITS